MSLATDPAKREQGTHKLLDLVEAFVERNAVDA
jgi:hypothetical protein